MPSKTTPVRSGWNVPLRNGLLCALLLLTGIQYSACEGKAPAKLETRTLTIERAVGAPVAISAELARTDDDRATGLMNRTNLPDGEGMLFIFDRDQMLSFWMKNTLIPLSIAYIAYDGRILELHDMKSQDLTAVRSSRSARYALEVPQGWFDRMGIGVGDRLILPQD
ncbi:hypothetical protein FACS189444_5880 [Spirochaetia bacterium]|nr:hypothetical protein FACS189444_5880 [Spirochaetia bacterium]